MLWGIYADIWTGWNKLKENFEPNEVKGKVDSPFSFYSLGE
jgi:hypothetical protein